MITVLGIGLGGNLDSGREVRHTLHFRQDAVQKPRIDFAWCSSPKENGIVLRPFPRRPCSEFLQKCVHIPFRVMILPYDKGKVTVRTSGPAEGDVDI